MTDILLCENACYGTEFFDLGEETFLNLDKYGRNQNMEDRFFMLVICNFLMIR
jgi:hypothetical protein